MSQVMAAKLPRVLYSVDWLQVFCLRRLSDDMGWVERVSPRPDRLGNHRRYRLCPTHQCLAGYKECRELVFDKYSVAVVAWSPSDGRRRAEGCAVKLVNPVLYCADWYGILLDCLAVLSWEPHNLTRLDLCADVNYFIGGLLPSTFIRKYICKQQSSYIRHGSNKWALYGRKEMRATIFDSIRWGSRSSGVSVYLYNKTKELREVKDKPWIRKAWESVPLSSALDVWRVEISITSQGLGLKDVASGLFHTLFVDDLVSAPGVQNMFLTFANRYFLFYDLDPRAKRKRDLKPHPLLPMLQSPTFMPKSMCEYVGAGRMERIISNRLFDVVEWLQSRDFPDKYDLILALQKSEVAFNRFYSLASRCHDEEAKLSAEMLPTWMHGLASRRSEAYLEKVRWARRHIESLRQIADEQIRDVISSSLDVP